MKNRFLISCITLIVFFNFTIPSYALAAPQKAFSRNSKNLPVPEEAVSVPTQAEAIPAYTIPELSAMQELPSYSLSSSVNVAAASSTLQNGMALASPSIPANEDTYVEGHYFIKFKDSDSQPGLFKTMPAADVFSASPTLTNIASRYQIRTSETKKLFETLVNSKESSVRKNAASLENVFAFVSFTKESAKLLEELRNNPRVAYVEKQPKIYTVYTPDDPQYTQQWHLDKIQSSTAWNIYNANPNNSAVKIAIVDDAVKLGHEDLNSNLWVNPGEIPGNGIDDDGNGYIDDINGWDAANNDNDPNPPSTGTNSYFMHGTHVAGIAAAVSNNATGVSSISGAGQNKVKIIAVKTKEDSSPGGSLETTLEGVQYAIAADADVINMSWGSASFSQTYQNLFITAHNQGITLVAASGNNNSQTYFYPASYLYVVSVGATNQSDQRASFSNYGARIDVMAPGVSILSTLPLNNNSYGNLDGTSMASPLVAGLAGLMLSYNNTLTPHQIEILLEENCDNIDAQNPNYIGKIGAGRINADNVIQDLQAENIPSPEEFTAINIDNFPGLDWSTVVWGDYDSDGYLDFVAMGNTGWDYSSGPIQPILFTKIYHNNGDGTFTDINADISQFYCGDFSWGDYDNDGDLDLLMLGTSTYTGASGGTFSKLYRNDGNNIFTNVNVPFLGFFGNANASWGDYDNDGDLDVLLSGQTSSGGKTKIYRNDNGVFVDSNVALPQLQARNAWGDYDNDGKLDILFSGWGQWGGDLVAKIYHNNGDSTFTDINAGLDGLGSYCAWGDYDNDGDLDVLLSGYENSPPSGYTPAFARVYRNDSGVFVNINNDIPGGGYGGGASWGDYDNDGYLDILVCGNSQSNWQATFGIYHNNHDNTFTNVINSEFEKIVIGDAAFGDYDNDGDLDILSTGEYLPTGIGEAFLFSTIYRNNSQASNTNPGTPVNPQANVSGSDVVLSWQKSTDAQTPQNGLSYNIFMGTTPNSVDIESPMAQLSNGWRKIAALGSQNENTSWTIKNLPNGTYYWGVQAIDTAFAGSPFATGSFTIGGPTTFTVSGTVKDTANNNISTAQLSATVNGNTIDPNFANGSYSFTVNSGDNVSLTPSAPGYTFTPVSKTFTNITANQTQNFVGVINTYSISGTVYKQGGGTLANAAINLSTGQATTTNASGQYSFNNIAYNWNGTISALKAGYTIMATAPLMTVPLISNQTQNFNATQLTFSISGNITGLQSGNTYLVEVAGTGTNGSPNLPAVPGTNGSYAIPNVPYGWTGSLNATSVAYDFTPVSISIPAVTTNLTGKDFAAMLKTFTVNGSVSGLLSGNTYPVTITAQGTSGYSDVTADATSGSYSMTVPYGWTGSLVASSAAYNLVETPPATFTSPVTANQVQNYASTLKTFTVNGSVSGLLSGNTYPVTITAQGASGYSDVTADATSGSYSMTVPYGWTGGLVASSAAYNLVEAPSVTFTSPVTANQVQNYNATLKTFSITGSISGLLSGNTYPVTITASGTPSFNVTVTGSSYIINDVPYGWSGSLSATSVAYNITPVSIAVNALIANLTDQNFNAVLKTFTLNGDISGLVPGTNYPITIEAQASGAYSTITADASSGHYTMTLPYGWTGDLVASSPAYDMMEVPAVTFITPVTQDQVQNYDAKLKKFAVSGAITGLVPGANYPITITAQGINGSADVTADATSGNYAMTLPYGWQGALVVSSVAYILIEDPNVTFSSPVMQDQVQNYLAKLQTFSIKGTVYQNNISSNTPGIKDVRLDAKGTVNAQPYTQSVMSDGSGNYTITVPYGWTGQVVPSKNGYTFIPERRSYENVMANYMNQHYVGTLSGPTPHMTYVISGTIKNLLGQPMQGVVLKDSAGQIVATTNVQGFYTLTKVKGWTGTITPIKTGYKFNPGSRSYTNLGGNQVGQDFAGK